MTASPTVAHGGMDLAELRRYGIPPEAVMDFSASINPLGTPLEVKMAIAAVDPSAYPDRACSALREALATRLDASAEAVLVGNGSTELIHLVARAYLRAGQTAAVFTPTFGEYQEAAARQDAQVTCLSAAEAEGFHWHITRAVAFLREHRPALTFLCNPNNPTGVFLEPGEVQEIAQAAAPGLLVLDEAYMPFSERPWDALPVLRLGNVLLLRSMTKDYGLAGARLGYLVGPPRLLEAVRDAQPSWSVNAFAQAAGLAALGCEQHLGAGRATVAAGKEFLWRELLRLGLAPNPGAANFLLVKVGDARTLRSGLLRRGILVRDCASFGIPEHIRISVKRPEECRLLIEAMREVLSLG